MKFPIILLVGMLFLAGCASKEAAQEPSVPGLEERINEEGEFAAPPEPEQEARVLGERLVGNQSSQLQGVFVSMNGIFYNAEENRIYFDFSAENRNERPETRDALKWKAILYFTRNEQINLFLCDFSNGEASWNASYCEERRNIPKHWYSQKMWMIYTLNDPSTIRDGKSILDVIREEDTFAFKVVIPSP